MIDATSALPQVGELVPRFEARLMTGGIVNADSLVGAPFVTTDCPGSRQALRGLQSLHETLRERGVRFLILATDTSRTALETFLQQQDVRIPVAQIDAAQVRGFVRSRRVGPDAPYQVVFSKPSFLVTDAATVIVAREGGGLRDEFLREVQELLAASEPTRVPARLHSSVVSARVLSQRRILPARQHWPTRDTATAVAPAHIAGAAAVVWRTGMSEGVPARAGVRDGHDPRRRRRASTPKAGVAVTS